MLKKSFRGLFQHPAMKNKKAMSSLIPNPSATDPFVALPPRRLFPTPLYLLHPWSRASMQSSPEGRREFLR
jgi:hypothetical protein